MKTIISQNMHSMLAAYKLGYNRKTSDTDERLRPWCATIGSGKADKVNKECVNFCSRAQIPYSRIYMAWNPKICPMGTALAPFNLTLRPEFFQ